MTSSIDVWSTEARREREKRVVGVSSLASSPHANITAADSSEEGTAL